MDVRGWLGYIAVAEASVVLALEPGTGYSLDGVSVLELRLPGGLDAAVGAVAYTPDSLPVADVTLEAPGVGCPVSREAVATDPAVLADDRVVGAMFLEAPVPSLDVVPGADDELVRT